MDIRKITITAAVLAASLGVNVTVAQASWAHRCRPPGGIVVRLSGAPKTNCRQALTLERYVTTHEAADGFEFHGQRWHIAQVADDNTVWLYAMRQSARK